MSKRKHFFCCDFLQVSKPFVFSDKVKPVKLRKGAIKPGKIVRVSGWGDTKEDGYSSKFLQQVALPVLRRKKCKQLYKTETITSKMFCAGKTGRDSCQGDSGGAVVYRKQQIGIVSWGEGCGTLPGVYTNVGKFRLWIKRVSGVKSV
jgi:trypsin